MKTVKIGDHVIGGSQFALIGGPCVVESRDICFKIAEFLKELCESKGVFYIFKASFDKANRSSGGSFRGKGMEYGLEILHAVRDHFKIPVLTDIHESDQAGRAAEVVDVLQIPAFLCRQTDLLVAAAKTGLPVNVKKGQFMAPEDMNGVVDKLEGACCKSLMLTERGTSFGYHNLVVDMRSLQTLRSFGYPVVFDATHSVQLPGGLGNASGGQREFIPILARSAAAAGIDAIFMEVHPNPEKALSDGPNSLRFKDARKVIDEVLAVHELIGKMC